MDPTKKEKWGVRTGIQRWNPHLLIVLAAGFLMLCSILYAVWPDDSFTLYVPRWNEDSEIWAGEDELEVSYQENEILEMEGYSFEDKYVKIHLKPVRRKAEEHLEFHKSNDDEPAFSTSLKINEFGNVYDPSTGNYNGYEWVLLTSAIFVVSVSLWFCGKAGHYIHKDRYDYKSVFYVGLGIYLFSVGIILFIEWFGIWRNPYEVTRWSVWEALADSGKNYMIFSLPFLVVFAVSMTVSNIFLIRHEGRRLKNIFGMILGAVLLAGVWIGIMLEPPAFDVAAYMKWWKVLMSVYTSGFVFLECMLIGTILCSLLAVQHIPAPDKDFVIILGCGFASDGHLYPLLKGRVDKAIEFREFQRNTTGKRAVFVPSGGRGNDEPFSEAEAMKRYLLTKGYTEKDILPEDKSRNTYENMLFSKELTERQRMDSRCVFVTTNYHLFRSGILARKVRFMADGLGSSTKWYFWPNAFSREFLGLMRAKLCSSSVILIIMILVYVIISFLGGN